MESIEYLWKDRKRYLGLPLSFTRYRLSEDRLFCETGFFNIKSDEVLLYRVRDLELIPYDNHRSSFRQVLNVPAAFYTIEDTYLNMPQECRILDISTGGARVASSYRYGEGDVLRLRGELVKGSGYMSFTCKVVRVAPAGSGGFEYGVLFAQLKQRQISDLTNDIRQIQKETQRKLSD